MELWATMRKTSEDGVFTLEMAIVDDRGEVIDSTDPDNSRVVYDDSVESDPEVDEVTLDFIADACAEANVDRKVVTERLLDFIADAWADAVENGPQEGPIYTF